MLDVGHLTVDLRNGVSIATTRPRALGRILIGKTPEQALATIPLMFLVCRHAQAEACRQALKRAGAVVPEAASPQAVKAEAVREHLMRIAVDWTKALAESPDPDLVRRVFGLTRETSPKVAAALLAETRGIVERLLNHVERSGWSHVGIVPTLHPDETTAFTMVARDQQLADLGNGLMARLKARLVHIERCIEHWDEPESLQVETSRGLLRHDAVITGGVVEAYTITAPTDVNFTKGGPLALSLEAQRHWEPAAARLLVEAFDPCISYTLLA